MTLELRPEVAAFAQIMEWRLRESGQEWQRRFECSADYLIKRLTEKLEELISQCQSKGLLLGLDVPEAAADVANYAMMIADVREWSKP